VYKCYPLPNVFVGKDLGPLIDSDLNFSSHIDVIDTKAHQPASLILRCFKCRDPDLLFQVFFPRCMKYKRGLAMRILSIRLSVCLSDA